ncbi:MAG: exodeoxyribonuclease VII large subunit [Cytophagaceae bacterium]|nr:exodeoxyribonuclease VII large subunit [Gemmatimonadaceae bacterium]
MKRGPGPRSTPIRGPEPDLFPGAATPAPAAKRKGPVNAMPGESPEGAFSVDDLAQLVRTMVQGSFPPMWVSGEVSQFTKHRNGHWYFTLKGEQSSIRCVMWASATYRVPTAPDEGMKLVVLGALDVFTGRTDLQFSVRAIQAQGDGLWRKAFEEVRGRLLADGLLDDARKRSLPFFPRCLAVITSADGAAFHDVVSVARQRNPLVNIILVPAAVQGEDAARSLRIALDRLYRWGGADVAIIGRGGGSREDLWCFNDEKLARKIGESPIPVISAVGHEVDVTICDLVADFRAATPSAAAERAVPILDDLVRVVRSLGRRLSDASVNRVRDKRRNLSLAARRATLAANGLIEKRQLHLKALAGKLHVLSPLATLSRGYAVVTDDAGHVITSVEGVDAGDAIVVRLRDGQVHASVDRTARKTNNGELVAPPDDGGADGHV